VAPHLDYDRGWPNYAGAYYLLRSGPAPDRVVVLGTNHFGTGDGVVVTEFGFETPMGRCPTDPAVLAGLVEELGGALTIDQLDHLAEHSITLQLPWIQYCFGQVPIVAALIPDPLTPMLSDDGERVDGRSFARALGQVLDRVSGRTLFVASSDLSHVGPQFGEPTPVDEQRRVDVEQHDRDLLGKFVTGDAEEFLGAVSWSKNPTRWCSVGNMHCLLQLVEPQVVELIDYRQACDPKGLAMVSSAAVVMQ
jgi:AmmeMemoRadiSam system protein B